jgi:hypothetical protein
VSRLTWIPGKGLLADTITLIGTGYQPTKWSQVLDEDEERKRLLTVALSGDPVLCVDNITQPFGSAPLDALITARVIEDRVLGKTQKLSAPANMVIIATGNNLAYRGDMARRVVPIELYTNLEHPEQRTGFQHSPLLPWVASHRPRLVVAALTVLRAFFVAGCPPQQVPPMGSFEPWSDLVRQSLVWAGQADPAEGRATLAVETDPDLAEFAELLQCWLACYDAPVTLKEAIQDAKQRAVEAGPRDQWNDLRDVFDHFAQTRRDVAYTLRKYKGRIVNGAVLRREGTNRKGFVLWSVKPVGPAEDAEDAEDTHNPRAEKCQVENDTLYDTLYKSGGNNPRHPRHPRHLPPAPDPSAPSEGGAIPLPRPRYAQPAQRADHPPPKHGDECPACGTGTLRMTYGNRAGCPRCGYGEG